MERIGVKLGDYVRVYGGLGGTFLSLVDSCTRRGVLPGFVDDNLLAEATRKNNMLVLRMNAIAGKKDSLSEILDMAMYNLGAYPAAGYGYDYLVEIL